MKNCLYCKHLDFKTMQSNGSIFIMCMKAEQTKFPYISTQFLFDRTILKLMRHQFRKAEDCPFFVVDNDTLPDI